MSKKATNELESPRDPNLVESRESARQKIQAQIGKGQSLRDRALASKDELAQAEADRSKWRKYSEELLSRLFDNAKMRDEFSRSSLGLTSLSVLDFTKAVDIFRSGMGRSITALEAIRDRLDLIPEPSTASSDPFAPVVTGRSRPKIFVVHGHDEAAKQTVARFLEQLHFEAIILHEQPNAGRTIIEKLEDYADVDFAVVLLTPDDVGSAQGESNELKPRTRQNVVLELGLFYGKLGRQRGCALYQGDIELPSDIHGILYVAMDGAGAWRGTVAKEMKQAGLPVDMNKL